MGEWMGEWMDRGVEGVNGWVLDEEERWVNGWVNGWVDA